MTIHAIVAGDTTDNNTQSTWVAQLMHEHRASWDAFFCVGDNQYYGGLLREWYSQWDTPSNYSRFNEIAYLIRGNHDICNPVGSVSLTAHTDLAKWKAGIDTQYEFVRKRRFCIPHAAADATGLYYWPKVAGRTGSSEPDWPRVPGAEVRDGSTTWLSHMPGQDYYWYVNSKPPYAKVAGMDRLVPPRLRTGKPLKAMQAIFPTGHGKWNSAPGTENPHQEYYPVKLNGSDSLGSYTWLVWMLDTELEYGQRSGDTHDPRGYGPSVDAGISPKSRQYRWFKAQLEANGGNPRKIMMVHWPWFWLEGIRDSMRPIYQLAIDHGVKLIFSGHQHNYVRFNPVDRNAAVKPSTNGRLAAGTAVHVVIGNGGHSISGVSTGGTQGRKVATKGSPVRSTGSSKAATGNYYGATHLALDRNHFQMTHLITQRYGDYPLGNNGSVFDRCDYSF